MLVPKLSIVVPIYNEKLLLTELLTRFEQLRLLLRVDHELSSDDIELVLVNDGSDDGSKDVLLTYVENHADVVCVNLARNFGHQMAITAGLLHSKGDAVVMIDGDLQDPPEFISSLYRTFLEGYDVVYGIRRHRRGESWFKLITATWFYRIISKLSRTEIVQNVGDFRLLSRRVVNILNQMPEQHRFLRGMVPWIGFKQTGIYYERDARTKGTTKYSLRRMLRLSLDGITSFSVVPLKLIMMMGFMVSISGFAYAAYAIYEKVVMNMTVPGWTSMIVIILVIGGFQLLCLGVVGEYIARIHDEVKQRPLYTVEGVYTKEGRV